MFMASAVLPIEGRAAMTIISAPCRPSVILSNSAKPVGRPVIAAAPVVQLLDRVDGLHHLVLHARRLVLEAILRDREDLRLHVVEQVRHVVLLVVAARGVFGADVDDLPEGVFLLQDLDVIGGVRGRREEGE